MEFSTDGIKFNQPIVQDKRKKIDEVEEKNPEKPVIELNDKNNKEISTIENEFVELYEKLENTSPKNKDKIKNEMAKIAEENKREMQKYTNDEE